MSQIIVKSISPSGRVRKHTCKPSVYAKTKQLLNELGIDPKEYKNQASFRLYSRMASHPVLGVQSIVNN